jgi:hypothetical protein
MSTILDLSWAHTLSGTLLWQPGSWGVPHPSLADYVMGTGTRRGATAAGKCLCWLSSHSGRHFDTAVNDSDMTLEASS